MTKANVSPNITFDEYACKHCHRLPFGFLDDDMQMSLEYQVLFEAFEKIRSGRGGTSLAVTSGYRCKDHEQAMYDAWVLGGKKGEVHGFLSVHMFGVALDIQAESKKDQERIVALARKLKPKPRIGWKQYQSVGSFIVHIDFGQFIQPSPTESFKAGLEW